MSPMQLEVLVRDEARRLAHAAEHEPPARPTRRLARWSRRRG